MSIHYNHNITKIDILNIIVNILVLPVSIVYLIQLAYGVTIEYISNFRDFDVH
ncbi:hypothetical protein SLVCU148_0466 [Staphylococcus lugdunensis VCU148]|uniref:Uncharacterized protein n=1 Tax=Staphylococcus lugdunensis TaxID=28035 RepID=A0ABD4EEJ9_STALU|nr:hypothetical protein SLGD_01471 [Staphylococcus lugdunensis HKU09-01]EFU84933.1 hypothetical protein HMPREF0790_0365 [Staphylococcus lugdunensis M23590]KAK62656.1 hypothetical protein SLVCU148_0466 [Staphylococcus lugdunensis VCU148]KXA37320.1 hypothetical protein HMPREF3225_01801 [Staphylococcus lugdunensis]CCB53954.1 hypothetical protein SLUG_14690 [Staphylococcus lugdunensis N920143]